MIDVLQKELDSNKVEYLNYLKQLVNIDTQHIGQGIEGGREFEGQQYLANLAQEIGATRIVFDQMQEGYILRANDEYGEGNLGHNYINRENLYITFEGKAEGKTLMFNSHMDTMPPGPLELWENHPHEATERDGKLYGLGTADMKAGLMASLLAVKLLKDVGAEVSNNVIITSVVDEEGGGNGSIQAAYNTPSADAVVVCEGTDCELILAHMGFVFFRITTIGKANHAGEKYKGISAIEKMQKVISSLQELEYGWLFKYKHKLLPPPNINFGVLKGGTSGATVPGKCELEICIHYHPNTMDYDSVTQSVIESVNRVAESDPWLKENPPILEVFQKGGAFENKEGTEIVTAFKKSYQEIMGREVKIVGSPAGCDSRIWKNISKSEMIQYGPGRLTECHSPNEFVKIDEFYKSILTYAMLILNYAKVKG